MAAEAGGTLIQAFLPLPGTEYLVTPAITVRQPRLKSIRHTECRLIHMETFTSPTHSIQSSGRWTHQERSLPLPVTELGALVEMAGLPLLPGCTTRLERLLTQPGTFTSRTTTTVESEKWTLWALSRHLPGREIKRSVETEVPRPQRT